MKFSQKCRTEKLGVIYTILGSFCLFLNWEVADIWPQIRLRKLPDIFQDDFHSVKQFGSRSGPTEQFAKVIGRQQKLPLARKEFTG